jgi:WNK lysine deficient protein kinase
VCAVKILNLDNLDSFLGNKEDIIRDFQNEIEILETLENSEYIVKYLFHEYSSQKISLYMEYFPTSLHKLIQERSSRQEIFSPGEIQSFMLEAAKALHYLHSRKPPVIHRDLKSDNIFISLNDRRQLVSLKLGDFGISKILTEGVQLRTVEGTPGFQAPEVLEAPKRASSYTVAADIYSLGMVLFELLTLQRPYQGENFITTLVVEGKLPSNKSLFPKDSRYQPFIELWYRCVALNPADRPSALDLVIALTLNASSS